MCCALNVFRRESDEARHKCVTERRKPVNEQAGAVAGGFEAEES